MPLDSKELSSKSPQSHELQAQWAHLRQIILSLGSTAVAYSGGTDSSYLLAVCVDELGAGQVLALTADSPLTPRGELDGARILAEELSVQHIVLPISDLDNPGIVANPPDRCYHCKFSRFDALKQVAWAKGLRALVHGENADDVADYRPGSRAAEELGVRAPLREAGLTKTAVRTLSRLRGLPNWSLPANACLASRFPYGTRLTAEGLARVDAAEETLRDLWHLEQIRVRDHYPVARIEAPQEDIARLSRPEIRTPGVEALRSLGYRYVTLDLNGYRMGSLNDGIESESPHQ
jgi:uncharacterized protein